MANFVLLKWYDHNNKRQRIKIIEEMSYKWRDISYILGISLALTEQIELNYARVQDRCQEVIRLWLSSEDGEYRYSTTWESLIELLEDIDLSTLATEIQDVVCQKSV